MTMIDYVPLVSVSVMLLVQLHSLSMKQRIVLRIRKRIIELVVVWISDKGGLLMLRHICHCHSSLSFFDIRGRQNKPIVNKSCSLLLYKEV